MTQSKFYKWAETEGKMTSFQFGQWAANEDVSFVSGSSFVSSSGMSDYTLGFLNVKPNDKDATAYAAQHTDILAALREIDLTVDAAQRRPDEMTPAQRDAAPVVDRPQMREDDGEIIFAF